MAKKAGKKTAHKKRGSSALSAKTSATPPKEDVVMLTLNGVPTPVPRSLVEQLMTGALSQATTETAVSATKPLKEKKTVPKQDPLPQVNPASPLGAISATKPANAASVEGDSDDGGFDIEIVDDAPARGPRSVIPTEPREIKAPYGTKRINTARSTHYRGYHVLRRTLLFLEREKIAKGKPINQETLIDALQVFNDEMGNKTRDVVEGVLRKIERLPYLEKRTLTAIKDFRKRWLPGTVRTN